MNKGSAAFGRLRVETKLFKSHLPFLRSAAFGRLRVETIGSLVRGFTQFVSRLGAAAC